MPKAISILCVLALTSGCAVGKIVTAPVRAAGTVIETGVDATTTTKSEREEDRGRQVIKQEKRAEKERRKRDD